MMIVASDQSEDSKKADGGFIWILPERLENSIAIFEPDDQEWLRNQLKGKLEIFLPLLIAALSSKHNAEAALQMIRERLNGLIDDVEEVINRKLS
jgi:hypothetical protein